MEQTELEERAPAVAAESEVAQSEPELLPHVGWLLGGRYAGSAPPPQPGRGGLGAGSVATMLGDVQRLAGNTATGAVVRRLYGGVQRLDESDEPVPLADVSVTDIVLTADTVTLPLEGVLRASVEPVNATGVTYSVSGDTVEPTNVTIDENTGVITIADGQPGGEIMVNAEAADGSSVGRGLIMIERPGAVSATEATGTANYGGQFTHTFTTPSGTDGSIYGAEINKDFASTTATPPWGGNFELTANAAGSQGWGIDAKGKLTGPDNVTIASRGGSALDGVNIGKLFETTSNPHPTKPLPQGFTMTQRLYSKRLPSGTLEGTPFTTIDHVRTLLDGPQFEVRAGLDSITEPYSGLAAVHSATASSTVVMVSPPRPEAGEWSQRKVTVTATAVPGDAALAFTIRGNALGCEVDDTGEVSIGERTGTITVRVSANEHNYDEVRIRITSDPAEAAAAPAPSPESTPSAVTSDEPVTEATTDAT